MFGVDLIKKRSEEDVKSICHAEERVGRESPFFWIRICDIADGKTCVKAIKDVLNNSIIDSISMPLMYDTCWNKEELIVSSWYVGILLKGDAHYQRLLFKTEAECWAWYEQFLSEDDVNSLVEMYVPQIYAGEK